MAGILELSHWLKATSKIVLALYLNNKCLKTSKKYFEVSTGGNRDWKGSRRERRLGKEKQRRVRMCTAKQRRLTIV